MMSSTESNILFLTAGHCLNDCESVIQVGEVNLFVCREHLSKISPFFKTAFIQQQQGHQSVAINDEKTDDLLLYLTATHYSDTKVCRIVDDDNLMTLMRLANKFETTSLKDILSDYIQSHVGQQSADTSFDWLIACISHGMPQSAIRACMPGSVALSLDTIQELKNQIGLEIYAKLLELKLRISYVRSAAFPRGARSTIYMGNAAFCNKCIGYEDLAVLEGNCASCGIDMSQVKCPVCKNRSASEVGENECPCAMKTAKEIMNEM